MAADVSSSAISFYRPRVCVCLCMRVCVCMCVIEGVCFAIPRHCNSANSLILAVRVCVLVCVCVCVSV